MDYHAGFWWLLCPLYSRYDLKLGVDGLSEHHNHREYRSDKPYNVIGRLTSTRLANVSRSDGPFETADISWTLSAEIMRKRERDAIDFRD
jgi:hypothetical protein